MDMNMRLVSTTMCYFTSLKTEKWSIVRFVKICATFDYFTARECLGKNKRSCEFDFIVCGTLLHSILLFEVNAMFSPKHCTCDTSKTDQRIVYNSPRAQKARV